MKLLNLKNGGLLIDAFCAFGISCAILCVILPFTFPVRSYKDVIILTAIAMIIVLIFSRKWWLLPSTIAVLTPIGLLIVSLLDPDRRFLAALRFCCFGRRCFIPGFRCLSPACRRYFDDQQSGFSLLSTALLFYTGPCIITRHSYLSLLSGSQNFHGHFAARIDRSFRVIRQSPRKTLRTY